jgi:hypothetical protein
MQDPNATPTCLTCQMTDPPPSMTCRLGRDHRVGRASGCPTCGRLMAACARRPCSPMRAQTQWPAGIAKVRLRLGRLRAVPWPAGTRPGRRRGAGGTG